MAFCNSCGAPLAEGTKFCGKCGAAIQGAPAAAPPAIAPGPPPSPSSSSGLKMVLMIVGVIVFIGILGMVTCGIIVHRAIKSARVSRKGDNVKVETPFGPVETNHDPQKIAERGGLMLRPGKQRRTAANRRIALPDFLHNVWRPRAATPDVTQVAFHVFHPLRSAVSEQKNTQRHGLNSRTISTTALTFSAGVSGRMPWPKLKIWPGRVPVRFSSSKTLARNS